MLDQSTLKFVIDWLNNVRFVRLFVDKNYTDEGIIKILVTTIFIFFKKIFFGGGVTCIPCR